MGLDYSFLLFFKKQNPWNLLEGVAEFADHNLESNTAIRLRNKIMRLPFESWAGTEKKLPIPYYDGSNEWKFMTSLYFEVDDELYDYAEYNKIEDVEMQQRVAVGYIYLTVCRDSSVYSESYDPNLILLHFAAATTRMSTLFARSYSMRKTFTSLLDRFQGVYGLIDRENDAVLFWLRGKGLEVEIPDAWMALTEIEAYRDGEDRDK